MPGSTWQEIETEPDNEDYETECDRCLRTRKRSQLKKVVGEKVSVLVCKRGCEFVR